METKPGRHVVGPGREKSHGQSPPLPGVALSRWSILVQLLIFMLKSPTCEEKLNFCVGWQQSGLFLKCKEPLFQLNPDPSCSPIRLTAPAEAALGWIHEIYQKPVLLGTVAPSPARQQPQSEQRDLISHPLSS